MCVDEQRSIDWEQLIAELNQRLATGGFEGHPFQVDWYNELVSGPFQLTYEAGTMALVVLSTPKMFELTFVPFVQQALGSNDIDSVRDPMDQCMKKYFSYLIENLPVPCDVFFDFDMTPHRRPKILMQTAGHVAGAAYYYRNTISKTALGVSIHPKYGGWFGFRAVIVFKAATNYQLIRREPVNLLPEKEDQLKLLSSFMYSWQSYEYRDCVEVVEKYSDLAIKYFATKPGERMALLNDYLQH